MIVPRSSLPPEICTTDSAAKILGCTRGRIRQFITDGRLMAYRLGDRIMLLDHRQVQRLAKEPRVTGRPRGGALLD